MPNADIAIRKALPGDAGEAARFFFLSAPFLGDILGGETRSQRIFIHLFQRSGNLFSFNHTHLAEKEGTITGMVLGYEWLPRRKEGLRTGFLLLRQSGFHFLHHLRFWQNLSAVTGTFHPQGYYLSNLAVDPAYQGQGIGTKLLLFTENTARRRGCLCVELDVSGDNLRAIDFYRHLEYQDIGESRFSHRGMVLTFIRMMKPVR